MHISTSHAVESHAPAAAQERSAQATAPTRAAEREANPNAEDARPTKSVMPAVAAARLSGADLRLVEQLEARDREVRAHEQAHLAAGGSLTRGGARFSYEQGPDGRRYAVGGEVTIESAEVAGDPQATVERAAQVQRAALAPAAPSAQDRAVAAEAAATASRARAEARAEASAEADTAATAPAVAGEGAEAVAYAAEPGPGSSAAPDDAQAATPPAPSAEPNVALYESVASIEDPQAGGTSVFEPVVA